MNGWAIPGAYLSRLYVCDKEMSWPHHIGETHQPNWVVYVQDSEKFRLMNVIPEGIIFVSRGITVLILATARNISVSCIKASLIIPLNKSVNSNTIKLSNRNCWQLLSPTSTKMSRNKLC